MHGRLHAVSTPCLCRCAACPVTTQSRWKHAVLAMFGSPVAAAAAVESGGGYGVESGGGGREPPQPHGAAQRGRRAQAVARAYRAALVAHHPDRALQRGLDAAGQLRAEEVYKLLQNLHERYVQAQEPPPPRQEPGEWPSAQGSSAAAGRGARRPRRGEELPSAAAAAAAELGGGRWSAAAAARRERELRQRQQHWQQRRPPPQPGWAPGYGE